MVDITVDGRRIGAEEGTYLLPNLLRNGFDIPRLCHHDALEPWGGCRLCMVEITRPEWEGWSKLVIACMFPVEEGLIVSTASPKVIETRRICLDLLLARCPDTPLIQEMAGEYGIDRTSYDRNPDPNDCILCGLCTRVCDHLGMSAISMVNRGWGREVAPPGGMEPPDCIGCLSCAEICPTDYIQWSETATTRTIWGKSFELENCPRCGKAHITKEEGRYFSKKQDVPYDYFTMCDECKRDHYAEKFASMIIQEGS